MIDDWQQLLQPSGALFEHGTIAHFGSASAERAAAEGDTITPLVHLALLRLSGEDAVTFLQGQVTNDVRRVSPSLSQLSAYCSPKGRVQVSFRVFQRDADLYLRLPAELAERTAKRLAMFVLRSRVSLTLADDLFGLGVAGTGAAAWLAQRLGTLPEESNASSSCGEFTVIRVPGETPRYEIYGPQQAIGELWSARPEGVTAVGTPVWQWQELHAGLPQVYPATSELFVPQMINLQLVEGVSFQKGCYTGQEIVARMQYLGKLKRRMYLAHIDSDTPPPPGAELFVAGSESGQGPGNVVEAQPAMAGGYDLLAVIERSAVDANAEIRLYNDNGPKLFLQTLPYPFPVDA